jgi:signal transduction histidine kinase
MITKHLMALLVLMILAIVLLYALLVISIRQERMSETLLKQSGDMQKILAQRLHETQCQAGERQNGSGN